MGGYLLLIGFLVCGLISMDALFLRKSTLVRVWLGLAGGLLLMMWTPVLYAFSLDFTVAAQWLGLGLSALIAAGCAWGAQRKRTLPGGIPAWLPTSILGVLAAAFAALLFLPAFLDVDFTAIGCGMAILSLVLAVLSWSGLWRTRPLAPMRSGMPAWLPLVLVIPLAVLSGYLQYTHILREVDGTLHVGQSTYGDLCLHLGIATSLRNASFPPDYSILKGTLLGYPFLADSMVTSMLLFGSGLSSSFVVTGTLMMTLVYLGYVVLAWELTRRPAATVLSYILMFINGGLGFLYTFDGVMKDSTALTQVFEGYYQTPTNMPDLNLRWVNVICDMMIPQRTLLAGWTLLIPALYMLVTAIRENRRSTFVILGVWGGALPMIHTHSFLGLGMLSAGAMLYKGIRPGKHDRRELMLNFLTYGVIAVALALPQLLIWTFPQTINGGSLRFQFNWVNNSGGNGLIDEYFWFWIKNVGPVYLLILPAVLSRKKGSANRTFAVGALVIYIVAELILFQPNEYDNNKLFYVAFMAVLPSVGLYLTELWDRMRGLRGRAFFAALFIVVCTLSGSLSIGREVVSDYQLFGSIEVDAAKFIEENTDSDAMFLTGTQHNNAVAALTGRYILCGTGTYLYYHGVDYYDEQTAVKLLLESPSENEELFEEYGIDYVYLSSHERTNYDVDEEYFEENGLLIYSNFNVQIYALSDEAKAQHADSEVVYGYS